MFVLIMQKPAFLKIVISPEEFTSAETIVVSKLFELGLPVFHIRKSAGNAYILKSYLQAIPKQYHNRIVLHSCFELSSQFNIKGIHINTKLKPSASKLFETYSHLSISTSCHSIAELQSEKLPYKYAFLSPIFNSISKPGYLQAFSNQALTNSLATISLPCIALGGLSAANWPQAAQMGFAGAAFLGSVWQNKKAIDSWKQIDLATESFAPAIS
jgi:thiamine-phosphate pyrophosphorylase